MQVLFGEGCTENTFYTFYLWCSVLPFNLMRCIIAIAVTLPVYKHISRLINKLNDKLSPAPLPATEGGSDESVRRAKKQAIITVCVVAAVLVLLVAGVLLRYFLGKNR